MEIEEISTAVRAVSYNSCNSPTHDLMSGMLQGDEEDGRREEGDEGEEEEGDEGEEERADEREPWDDARDLPSASDIKQMIQDSLNRAGKLCYV